MQTNIYLLKNYKLLVVIPLLLLVISLYFIPKIQLDDTLRGGVTITLQSNGTANTRALVSSIDSRITGAEASVQQAPGGISITIASNESISDANNYLISAYSAYSNYTTFQSDVAQLQAEQRAQPDNGTVGTLLSASSANESSAYSALRGDVSSEFSALHTILPNATANDTSAQSLINSASAELSNANSAYEQYVLSTLKSIIPFTTYSYETVTPTLSSYFLSQIFGILVAAFILMAIACFFIFMNPLPSFTVVFGAVNDIVIALGAMGLFGIPLGVASIGGLLMLVGFSMDTDILSAIRILKRSEETPESRAYSTMKTGLTMTASAVIVFSILFIVSYISFIPTYYEIAGVVLAGLVGDMITTWLGDTVLILWYKKSREGPR